MTETMTCVTAMKPVLISLGAVTAALGIAAVVLSRMSKSSRMNVLKIALRNARGNLLKSAAIFLCVFGVAAFLVATLLVVRGAQGSLDRGLERLGADILVLPTGGRRQDGERPASGQSHQDVDA